MNDNINHDRIELLMPSVAINGRLLERIMICKMWDCTGQWIYKELIEALSRMYSFLSRVCESCSYHNYDVYSIVN